MPWIPQNIQKRVFRYVLSKLAVFSNLDLENLDVSLGTRSELSLRDVQLDTERLDIPGIYVRDGQIKDLSIKLAVVDGVKISGQSINLTVALSRTGPEEMGEDISMLLSKTTADIAESIMPQDDKDLLQDEGDGEGYGMGEFSNVVSRMVDVAISQLVVELRDIKIRISVDESAVLEVTLDELKMDTVDGTRHVSCKGIDVSLIRDDYGDASANQDGDSSADEMGHVGDDDSDSDDNQLMQSAVFSHEEASTMYLSAMSDVAHQEPPEVRLPVLACDTIQFSFKGIIMEGLEIEVGNVRICVETVPDSLNPLLDFFSRYHIESNSLPENLVQEVEKPPQFSLKNVNIAQISVAYNESFEISLRSITVTNSNTQEGLILEVEEISGIDSKTSEKALWFDKDDNRRSDLTCKIGKESLVVLVPNRGSVDLSINHILELVDVGIILSRLELDGGSSLGGEKEPSKYKVRHEADDKPQKVELQTNIFEGVVRINDKTSIDISMLPASLENNELKVGEIEAKLQNSGKIGGDDDDDNNNNNDDGDDAQFEHLSIKSLTMLISDGRAVTVQRGDTSEGPATVLSSLTVDTVVAKLQQSSLIQLGEDLSHIIEARSSISVPKRSSTFSSPPVRRLRLEDKVGRVKLDDIVSMSLLIKSINCEITTTDLGIFDLDIRRFENYVLDSGVIQSSIYDIHVSRDFSDIDEHTKHTPLVHIANPHMKDRPMVYLEVDANKITEIRFWNLAVEYHVRLLKLFDSSKQGNPELRKAEVGSKPVSGGNHDPSSYLENSADTIKQNGDIKVPISFIDCVIGLSPISLPSRGQLVIRNCSAEFHKYNDKEFEINLKLRKATLMLIDDMQYLESIGGDTVASNDRRTSLLLDQVASFQQQGYVSVGSVSSSSAKITNTHQDNGSWLDVDVLNELLVLETCADSTQTLLQLFNGLKPLLESGDEIKYHTEVMPFNVLEGIEESAFHESHASSNSNEDEDFNADLVADDVPSNLDFVESYYADRASRSQWTNSSSGSSNQTEYSRADLLLDQDLSILAANGTGNVDNGNASRRAAVFEQRAQSHEQTLDFSEDHFAKSHSDLGSLDSEHLATEENKEHSPTHPKPLVSIHFSGVKMVWDLHDGYDWAHTQDTITKAIKKVEVQAGQRNLEKSMVLERNRRAGVHETDNNNDTHVEGPGTDDDEDDDGEGVVHDMLFNSIYIGIPSNHDPAELRRAINRELNDYGQDGDDDISETASVGTTRSRSVTSANPGTGLKSGADIRGGGQKLKLKRSKGHKVKIEINGVDADISIFAGVNDMTKEVALVTDEEGQLLNRVNLRVRDFEIIDNVPTSTWNKFVSYMRSAGERESDASMLHLIMDTVKPIPDIAISEVIINISILPLRLHVDQDTLDFVTRFFEFKDERFADSPEEEETIFIQKFDIRAVQIKLDYKPKKVDYAGLKSGHVTEFMNFFILDEAEMLLRRIVLYGVPGFPRLAQSLHGIWMPDIRTTQLGEVLSGIAPVRSLIRLGSGVRDLVAVPVREYRKDGRIVRSLQKGAVRFATTTTNELVKFGAKLAAGTQTFLESAEQAMGGTGASGSGRAIPPASGRAGHQARQHNRYVSPYSDDIHAFDDSSDPERDEEDYVQARGHSDYAHNHESSNNQKVSLYANQPRGINQGLHVAYTSFGRNLAMARNAVGNISSEAADNGGNAQDAAAAVARAAPVALIRPIIGATEAVSKTLLGVTNQMDPEQMADVEDKYKRGGQDGGATP